MTADGVRAGHWMDRTVLVTGGLGFIGSHFVDELLARGARVVCLYRGERPAMVREFAPRGDLRRVSLDLLDDGQVRAVCRYVAPRIDTIVHCAALDGNAQFKVTHSAEILDKNLRITSNVLNAARECEVAEVVLLSSAEVYASDAPVLREEDDFRTSMKYSPNGYVLSKMFTEVLAQLYRDQFGLRVLVARPTNVYGPRDNVDGAAHRVIPSMLQRIHAEREIEVWGDGSQTRSFIYVKDMVRAVLRMAEVEGCDTLNLATTEAVSILELARLVASALGRPERIRLAPERPTGGPSRTLDTTRMERLLDFTPRTLRAGLAETAEWFLGRAPAPAVPGVPAS
jgi:dTDP-4-dehydro-6-deoxy-alpha-D-gulose 4-ketoreductase